MRAEVFIDQSEGGVAEISVVRHGLSSGAARKYRTVEEAMAVLLVFGFDRELVDHQLAALSEISPHVLLRFPVADIADDVLRSFGFRAAAFHSA
jgi:hypothetical protein